MVASFYSSNAIFFMVLLMQLPINFLSSKKDLNLKERTFQAISNLETEIKAMHSLRTRLQSNVNISMLAAMKSGDKESAIHHMEEYDDLVNLLNIVKSAETLLQNLSVKIDSVRYLQELVTILDSAVHSVNVIKSDISRLVPAVDCTLDRIQNSIVEIKASLKINEVMERKGVELPLTMPYVNIELPTTGSRVANIGAINLTTFTTAVHTQV